MARTMQVPLSLTHKAAHQHLRDEEGEGKEAQTRQGMLLLARSTMVQSADLPMAHASDKVGCVILTACVRAWLRVS